MLILKDKKAVLLKLRHPERVTTVIPTAKLVRHNHVTFTAVPHRPEETRVLRNLGFKVPDPMEYYYEWPEGFTPFNAQVASASFLSMHDRAFCLNSMGLGKTVTALAAFDYLRRQRVRKRALVVCPLSTMERAWGDEIFRWFPDMTFSVIYGTRARRRKLLQQLVDVYIINTDGIKIIQQDLKDRDDIDLVIVDEVAMFRNQATDRWKALDAVCNKQVPRWVWGMTGSPTPNGPTDAWAQCRLVVPGNPNVPRYFSEFRERVERKVSMYKWVPKENALEQVKLIMQPAIRFKLDDCIDLPEQIVETRNVGLTPEQDKAYKDMLAKLKAEYDSGQIIASNEAIKTGKLLQICAGVAYGIDGGEVILPNGPRINEVKEVIDASEGKVIVFVPLTGALQHLRDELAQHWWTEVVHGETKKADRDRIFADFQGSDNGPRVLVCNPGTMSHGLTLTRATTIIWFTPITSNETYEQACARVRRPGQKRTTVIVHLSGSKTEERLYRRLAEKQSVQGTLLEMMEELEAA